MTRRGPHVVVLTSTATSPSQNGWLFYYCQSCPGAPSVCASKFASQGGFDDEGWSEALGEFRGAHPHAEVVESRWAQ